MRNKRPKQALRVLDYMQRFGSITQQDASIDLGVARLASRISELKKEGHSIRKEMIKVKNRFGEEIPVARYYMGGDQKG